MSDSHLGAVLTRWWQVNSISRSGHPYLFSADADKLFNGVAKPPTAAAQLTKVDAGAVLQPEAATTNNNQKSLNRSLQADESAAKFPYQ
ncbi:hypothetical protein [Stutzerimonas stutzeri]|uniref:hypothetical protein n=1 Tax=Stutzerimonas stutzeri TaxID=316 RepID=UPI001184AE18|nr:hypothetical protein [Stutzerimonas stutzeri]MCQ4331503.1 hypothetical protein [Stutzerimonas stutzeri]